MGNIDAIKFFKEEIKDNNYSGIKLSDLGIEENYSPYTKGIRNRKEKRKEAYHEFVSKLHNFIARKNIADYVKTITFDEEFDASTDQTLFNLSGDNFDNTVITTNNIVGSIIYDKKPFNINCRFGNNFLQYMIASSSGFLELENLGGFSNSDELALGEWILIYYWKIQLKKTFSLGLYKTYQTKKDNLPCVRGRININDYIKKHYFDGKISCEYKEHSFNNEINHTISKALKKVFKGKYFELVSDIYEIKNAFDTIQAPLRSKTNKKNKILNPFYAKYNEVYQLSLKILNDGSTSLTDDKEQDFSAFLFDISLLFEHHIRKILLKHFTLFEKNKKEFSLPNGIDKSNIYPDVIINHGKNNEGKVQISIFDVKYKHFVSKGDNKGVDRNDRFQLTSYVAAHLSEYEVVECGFIYPSKIGEENVIKKQTLNICCDKKIPFKVILYDISNDFEKDKGETSKELKEAVITQQKIDSKFISFFEFKAK